MDDIVEHPNLSLGDNEDDIMKVYRARRAYFAKEVMASAIFQLGREGTGKGFVSPPFFWRAWEDNSNMRDRRIAKQELFRTTIEAGDALPFETPQGELFMNIKGRSSTNISIGEKPVGYEPYASKLERVVESIPAAFGEQIRPFDVFKLEWFTILVFAGFVGIRNQTKRVSRYSTDVNDKDSDPVAKSLDCDDVEFTADEDLALDSPGQQLGFERGATGSILTAGDKALRVFPFDRKALTNVSTTNRLVLKVAELVDRWLALVSGEQISFSLSVNKSWEELYLASDKDLTSNMNSAPDGTCPRTPTRSSERETNVCSHKLCQTQAAVVKAALEHQFAKGQQRYSHMEQTLTFMGLSPGF